MKRFLPLILLAALFPTAGYAMDRMPAPTPALAVGGAARPIPAWTEFCEKPEYARECALDLREPRSIVLTPRTWKLLVRVNRGVNAVIAAVADQDHWGREDVWDMAEDGKGDCEDVQLRKRRMLAAYGLPRRAMRMAAVALPDGTGHAVLTISTDRGDVVLDNRVGAVLPWAATGYRFIKRESQDGHGWVALDMNEPAPVSAPAWVSAIRR